MRIRRYIPVNTRYDGCNQKGCAGGSGHVCQDPPGQMRGVPIFLNNGGAAFVTSRTTTLEIGGARSAQNCFGGSSTS